jgi:exopolyphosphatase/guanosine-5'-triphosphate,3'-diphosphate pyrophosphatase
MLFAAIDIGSNAVRLFISNVYENNKIITIEKASLVRIPVRLGEDVFTTGIISEKKKQNLLKTLTAFKMLMEVYKPLKYRACATDAMRGASNSKEVLKSIKDNTGIKVDVIDGMEEARIISASNNIDLGDKYKIAMYVDVGGGSTEVSVLCAIISLWLQTPLK